MAAWKENLLSERMEPRAEIRFLLESSNAALDRGLTGLSRDPVKDLV